MKAGVCDYIVIFLNDKNYQYEYQIYIGTCYRQFQVIRSIMSSLYLEHVINSLYHLLMSKISLETLQRE